jgi:hypothetical protein
MNRTILTSGVAAAALAALLSASAFGAGATDPVPGALERMKPWPGLADAVTGVVMSSPKGRIHGHDADRIEITVDAPEDRDDGAAELRFVMPATFTLHGHRTVACDRAGGTWTCRDET